MQGDDNFPNFVVLAKFQQSLCQYVFAEMPNLHLKMHRNNSFTFSC